MKRLTFILDAGHGPATPGKRSPILPDGRQLLEYEFNRDVVERIAWEGQAAGLDIAVTPSNDYRDMGLTARAEWANAYEAKHSKVFISVHANAHGDGQTWTRVSGVEVWHARTSSASEQIAALFVHKLAIRTGFKNRGTKATDKFTVLLKTEMPAILTECGFFTNREECELLMDSTIREIIALAHVEAMIDLQNVQL